MPLRAAVYAQGQKSPVLELAATEISYGKIAAADVERQAAGRRQDRRARTRRPAMTRTGSPPRAQGLAAVQRQVGFTVSAPDSLAGLPRKEVRLVRFGSRERRARDLRTGPRRDPRARAQGRPAAGRPDALGGLRLPEVNIDGVTGSELATPLGTVLTFERDGVAYIVAGSVPPLAAENAARGLK